MICPLQQIPNGWGKYPNVFAKRLDLIEPGGGNKVFRFQQFLKEHKNINTLVALSNPGAHTFHVLKALIPNLPKQVRDRHSPSGEGNMKLLFLEQTMATNSYTKARQDLYLNKENIKVINAPFWQQLLRFLYYKYLGGSKYTTIGIGGHIDLKNSNPYEEVFREIQAHPPTPSQREGEKRQVIHLFPIASGNMADCFLALTPKLTNHRLAGVTTGGKRTFSYLNFKYRSNKNISLFRPLDYSYDAYKKKAQAFYDKSGFWLDPTHTIHLLDVLDQELLPKDAAIVMWITCPLVEKLYD